VYKLLDAVNEFGALVVERNNREEKAVAEKHGVM
jgi:hypothetical protein